jgi:glucarate dehydratase
MPFPGRPDRVRRRRGSGAERAGPGVTIDRDALERLHEQYLACGIRQRDDMAQMRKYDPAVTGRTPRF